MNYRNIFLSIIIALSAGYAPAALAMEPENSMNSGDFAEFERQEESSIDLTSSDTESWEGIEEPTVEISEVVLHVILGSVVALQKKLQDFDNARIAINLDHCYQFHGYNGTLLHFACFNGKLEIVKFLIKKGASKEVLNLGGYTPLQVACSTGHYKIAKFLIKEGAKINYLNSKDSLLHMACQKKGNLKIVKLLVEKGVNIEALSTEQETPLHIACGYNCYKIAEFLIKNNANIEALSNESQTPLHLACQREGNLVIVKLLIDNKANIYALTTAQTTPLHYACASGDIKIVKHLLDNGAKLEAQDYFYRNPRAIAREFCHYQLANFLEALQTDPQSLYVNTHDTCSICQEEFSNNQICTGLSCNHLFHIECLSGWEKESEGISICPNDRKKIEPKPLGGKRFVIIKKSDQRDEVHEITKKESSRK